MRTDDNGCSTCLAGDEHYEWFASHALKQPGAWGSCRQRLQYDYRTPAGRLFSTIADSLEEARARRDGWLAAGQPARYK